MYCNEREGATDIFCDVFNVHAVFLDTNETFVLEYLVTTFFYNQCLETLMLRVNTCLPFLDATC